MIRSPLVLLALLAGSVALSAEPAAASSNNEWSLYPYRAPGTVGAGRSDFNYSLLAGSSVTDRATLTNLTTRSLTFGIYGADAYNTAVGGGFALRPSGYRNVGVGAWVTLPSTVRRQITVPPRTDAAFSFALTVPAGTAPGDYAGGLVALNIVPGGGGGSSPQLHVAFAVGVRIYVHVIGPVRPGLAVSEISPEDSVPALAWIDSSSNSAPVIQVTDTGNTILPLVSVEAYITDIFGSTVHTFAALRVADLLPGQRVTLSEPRWAPLPLLGPLTVHVTGGAGALVSKGSAGFWVVPWLLLLLVVSFLAVAVIAIRWFRRARRATLRPAIGGG